MNQLNVEQMKDSLSVLQVARARKERALAYAARAESRYTLAIEILVSAMESDPTVIEARNELMEIQELLDIAQIEAETAGRRAWKYNHTDGKEEWSQDGWEIRIRETHTPIVVEPLGFLNHLEEIKADGVVREVVVKLNKKVTVDLNDRIPLNGLEIEEKATCSVRRGVCA